MGDIHYIVDKLNGPPFKYKLSLLEFSEKSSYELLQLLSDVFSVISSKHQKLDFSNGGNDQSVEKLVQFLKIIKYKSQITDPVVFRQLLASGDKEAIYPVLKWVIPQAAVLEKRAFVGYYLSFPDMPEEFNFDGDIMELKEEIKALQQEFIKVHKNSDMIKKLSTDSKALKDKIQSLTGEKERLGEKVERAKQQVDKVADRASYVDVCTTLRKAQDEEVYLSTQLQTQRQNLDKVQSAYHRATARLHELQSSFQDGNPTKLLEALQADVVNLRFQVNERFPKELEKRQKRMQIVTEALSSGANSEMDLQRMQQTAASLHTQVQEIQDRRTALERARQGDAAYKHLRQAQQLAAKATQKKDEFLARLERLQERKEAITEQLGKMEAESGGGGGMGAVRGAAGGGGGGGAGGEAIVFTEEEWRTKYESMKAKLPNYKRMKKELGDVEAEVFVLQRTEELLAQQEQALMEAVKKLEKQRGVTGFAEVATDLEKVSEAKSALDEEKGMTLQQISKTVEEINASINTRKTQLAPQIKKLRQMRQEFNTQDAAVAEKKRVYDDAVKEYGGRADTLEAEVSVLRQDVMDAEQKLHLVGCQSVVVDTNVKKVMSGPTAEVLRDKLETKIKEAEEQLRNLRDRQRDIRDRHNSGLGQIEKMNSVIQLLQLKLKILQGGASAVPGMSGKEMSTASANVLQL